MESYIDEGVALVNYNAIEIDSANNLIVKYRMKAWKK